MLSTQQNIDAIWKIMEQVVDPEVPVVSIVDLGIVKRVEIKNSKVEVDITPTYTGCPAMDVIATNIKFALIENGFTNFTIHLILSPAWTTDWITEAGKQKLFAYGIAPPKGNAGSIPKDGIECPQCNSLETIIISQFGSTACKALYKCTACLEPFDYFKCY
jgi:ring-1,2-phenylacetyl-CoA epoxidase subunit PaaD